MTFSELSTYLHMLRPDEVSGVVVGYDMDTHIGIASPPGMQGKEMKTYDVRPAFSQDNPNNEFLRKPQLFIAKNGRLNTNPPHTQPYHEIVYVLEGSITCTVNDIEVTIPAGAMLLMARDVRHHMYTCGLDDIAVSLFIDDGFLTSRFRQITGQLPSVGEIFKTKPEKPFLLVEFGVDSQTDYLGRMMLCKYFDPSSHSDLSTELLLLLFLTEADSVLNQTIRHSAEGIESALPRIIRYIEVHCTSVTLEEVSQKFGYSESYLSTAIRSRYGVSFTRYRNRLCMQYAAALLCSSPYSVTEIAAEVGVSTMSHFYKLFSAEFGIAPAEYRARYRPITEN